MKVYLNYEGIPDFTFIAQWDEVKESKTFTFEHLKKLFVNAYNSRFPEHSLEVARLILVSETKQRFHPESFVHNEVKNGDDLFVSLLETDPVVLTNPVESPVSKPLVSPESVIENEDVKKAYAAIVQQLSFAEQFVGKGNFRNACLIYEKILQVFPTEKNSLHHLGEIYAHAKKYDKAIQYFRRGLIANPNQIEFHLSLGDAYYGSGDYKSALKYYESALKLCKDNDSVLLESVKVRIGRALYKQEDYRDLAINTFMDVLKTNESNSSALIEYGIVLYEKKRIEDAMHVFLKLLIQVPNDRTVREYFSKLIQEENAISLLEKAISESSSSAAAFAFLASLVKDYGAVSECIQLYKNALKYQPDNINFFLSYVHSLELLSEYRKAFNEIQGFFENFPELAVGTLKCSHIYELIKEIVNVCDNKEVASIVLQASKRMSTVPALDSSIVLRSEELDLLALFFTIVKISFIVGSLELIAPLSALIEPIRGDRQLHLTTIRNEHAYYCCILQLMEYHKLPIDHHRPLYVVGDSHCLPIAWQTISPKGEQRLLKPLLVTGMKIWHLRKESHFYPKVNFYNSIREVPNGSDVLFLFGEIDCREGLVICVEKCRYESIEEGASTTIDTYIQVLTKLARKRHWNIFVHPIVPVLNETRHIVKLFNKILRAKLEKVSSLHYLDFFEKLLDENGALCKKFELDGTHMNPSYLNILNEALQKIE